MVITVGLSMFFVFLFIHGVILLGKFFVVKPLRDLYNTYYTDSWFGHIFFAIGTVVVIFSAMIAGFDSIGVKIGLTYATMGMIVYLLHLLTCILTVLIPIMKKFNQDLERKRG